MKFQDALGQILQEQHALSADERGVLDTLVEKHLSRHGSDVKQSLAALPAAPAVQRELSAVADPDVQASLGGITLAVPGDPNLTIPFRPVLVTWCGSFFSISSSDPARSAKRRFPTVARPVPSTT